jgi:4-amino-4-deoxy-L-arabinose transferase-like glycosyltransferase
MLWAALPLGLAAVIVLFFPFRYRIEFDADEGVNAIKSMMVLRGYRLYADIWSDQPPLFTYLLAGWFRVFGLRAVAGRGLVLLFATGLVSLAADYLRRTWGGLAAVCAVGTFLLLPFFPRLSVSMMIGLPAISLAFASLYTLARWHEGGRLPWLLSSALLLSLSILTKGFTFILAPIWLLGILLSVRNRATREMAGAAAWTGPALWLGLLALIGIITAVGLVGTANLNQLVDVHLQAGQTEAFQVESTHPPLEYYLSDSLTLFLLAAAGTWTAVRRRGWTALYLAAWIVVGYALLAVNSPAWYHHQLLLTIPATVLASIAVATSIGDLAAMRSRASTPLGMVGNLVCVGLFLAFLSVRLPGTLDGLDLRLPNFRGPSPGEEAERELLGVMGNHVAETRWLYTDRPMFAFLTQLPVPPNLAVITAKRLLTGRLTDAEVLRTLEEYKPEMILNARFSLPAVQEYMRTRNYARIDSTMKYRLYFRPAPP